MNRTQTDAATMPSHLLVGRLPGSDSWVRNSVLVIAGSLLIAATAQIEIPLWPVPVTGQTFGVLVVAGLLGGMRGGAAVLAYLIEGVAGLPFFSGGGAGPVHLFGPTGGYLIGFVIAAFLAGRMIERVDRTALRSIVGAMTVGTLVIFACGLAQLSLFVKGDALLASGLIPFLPGAVIKIVLAAAVVRLTVDPPHDASR